MMNLTPEPKKNEQTELTPEQIRQVSGGAEFDSPRLDDPKWESDIPKVKDVGEYEVYWYVNGDKNYQDVDRPIDAGTYQIQELPRPKPIV